MIKNHFFRLPKQLSLETRDFVYKRWPPFCFSACNTGFESSVLFLVCLVKFEISLKSDR